MNEYQLRKHCEMYALELEENGSNFNVLSTMMPSEGRRLILEDIPLETVEQFVTVGIPADVGKPKSRK